MASRLSLLGPVLLISAAGLVDYADPIKAARLTAEQSAVVQKSVERCGGVAKVSGVDYLDGKLSMDVRGGRVDCLGGLRAVYGTADFDYGIWPFPSCDLNQSFVVGEVGGALHYELDVSCGGVHESVQNVTSL